MYSGKRKKIPALSLQWQTNPRGDVFESLAVASRRARRRLRMFEPLLRRLSLRHKN
jgi:hypothetical protein